MGEVHHLVLTDVRAPAAIRAIANHRSQFDTDMHTAHQAARLSSRVPTSLPVTRHCLRIRGGDCLVRRDTAPYHPRIRREKPQQPTLVMWCTRIGAFHVKHWAHRSLTTVALSRRASSCDALRPSREVTQAHPLERPPHILPSPHAASDPTGLPTPDPAVPTRGSGAHREQSRP